jgi:hypothetical protein
VSQDQLGDSAAQRPVPPPRIAPLTRREYRRALQARAAISAELSAAVDHDIEDARREAINAISLGLLRATTAYEYARSLERFKRALRRRLKPRSGEMRLRRALARYRL